MAVVGGGIEISCAVALVVVVVVGRPEGERCRRAEDEIERGNRDLLGLQSTMSGRPHAVVTTATKVCPCKWSGWAVLGVVISRVVCKVVCKVECRHHAMRPI